MNVGDSTHERTGYERGATAVASEEIANSVSAGAGLIAAIAGIPLLLAFALKRFGPRNEIVFSPTFSGSIAATGKKSM